AARLCVDPSETDAQTERSGGRHPPSGNRESPLAVSAGAASVRGRMRSAPVAGGALSIPTQGPADPDLHARHQQEAAGVRFPGCANRRLALLVVRTKTQ